MIKLIFIFLMIDLIIITHQLTTFCVLLILISLYFSKLIYLRYYNSFHRERDSKKLVTINILIFFIISLIFYWTLMTSSDNSSFFSHMISRIFFTINNMISDYLSSATPPPTVYTSIFAKYDELSNLLYNFGFSLLLFFSTIGLLFSLQKKNSRLNQILFWICCRYIIFNYLSRDISWIRSNIYPSSIYSISRDIFNFLCLLFHRLFINKFLILKKIIINRGNFFYDIFHDHDSVCY